MASRSPSPAARELLGRLLADPARLREQIAAERARRSGSRSFAAFVKQAWPYVPQVEPLAWGWHLEAKCAHLEAVARGEIPKLVINEPPGHAKSVIMAVLWPAWIWTWWPKCQLLFASYSRDFVQRDAGRCRDVVGSDWYVENYSRPGGWALRSDQAAKANFANTVGGVRFSTSTDGQGAGLRAHVIGIDDPLNILEASSKAGRDAANYFIGQTLSQRFVAGSPPRVAMIMQRLHEEDATAFVLSGGDWEHLRLPSEYEADRPCVTHKLVSVPANGAPAHVDRVEFWRDPRRVEGELLFPEKFPRDLLDSYKRLNSLGEEGYSAQHQQRPTPAGGGMFKTRDWRFWKPAGRAPDWKAARPRGCATHDQAPPVEADERGGDMDWILISVDATFHKTVAGSFVAMHVWGARGAGRYLLDRVHERMDFAETVQALLALIKRWPSAREKIVEAKANGDAIVNTLTNTHGVSGVVPENPGKESKTQRASAMLPYHRAGNVYLPEGAPWLEEYIAEHAAFPNGRHDDDVDAQSQALKAFERERTLAEIWAGA